jgi:hypothetical protein
MLWYVSKEEEEAAAAAAPTHPLLSMLPVLQ